MNKTQRLKQIALNFKMNSFFQMNFEVFNKQNTIRLTIIAHRRAAGRRRRLLSTVDSQMTE